jgi:hypothetical protein
VLLAHRPLTGGCPLGVFNDDLLLRGKSRRASGTRGVGEAPGGSASPTTALLERLRGEATAPGHFRMGEIRLLGQDEGEPGAQDLFVRDRAGHRLEACTAAPGNHTLGERRLKGGDGSCGPRNQRETRRIAKSGEGVRGVSRESVGTRGL